MKKRIAIILTTLLIACNGVFAHPGRTDSNGCHTCRTNCSKYGLKTGEYHCHDGSSSKKTTTSNKSNKKTTTTKKPTSSTNSTKKTTVTKSSDNSLKSIEIDGKKIDLDKLEYTTYNQSITLYVTAKHSAAKIDYNKQIDLKVGKNKINIEVTAEDGTKKTYTVVVIREEQAVITSSNNVENAIYEEDIIESKNTVSNEPSTQNSVLYQTKQEDTGLGNLLITGGVCGLGYLGYKKYKKNKK